MKTSLALTLRSRGLVLGVYACLWLLCYLALVGLGGNGLGLRESHSPPAPPRVLVPGRALKGLFARQRWPANLVDTNALNPFHTRYFTPAAPPPPPPPTTRKIKLTYLGLSQTGQGPKQTWVKLGEDILVTPIGSNITANLYAAMATNLVLVVTNPAAQTNLLLLDTEKELEVPAR